MANKKTQVKETLIFPEDLATEFTYPDMMRFTIRKRDGVQMKDLVENFQNWSNTNQKPANQQNEESNAEIAQGNDDSIATLIRNGELSNLFSANSSSEIGGMAKGLLSSMDTFARKVFPESNPSKEIQSIYLPMPENLQYSDIAEWQAADLGALRGLTSGGKRESLEALKSAGFANLGSIISGGAGSLVSTVIGHGAVGGAFLGGLAGGGLQAGLESGARMKSNPFKEQTFQGVPFRSFEFAWTFSPTNEYETHKLREVITSFRAYSKPSYKDSKFFLSYPHEFQVDFLTLQKYNTTQLNSLNEREIKSRLATNENLPRLKHCICKSVNTNFATAGWHSFEAGAPTSITFQLQFEEIDIVTQNDVLDGVDMRLGTEDSWRSQDYNDRSTRVGGKIHGGF
tara:strand:- start:337 stop:1533 length:1197 start_codon:yes stop_codon:yes gene_type:complete